MSDFENKLEEELEIYIRDICKDMFQIKDMEHYANIDDKNLTAVVTFYCPYINQKGKPDSSSREVSFEYTYDKDSIESSWKMTKDWHD